MLARRRKPLKRKRPPTLNEAITIIMAIHLVGMGAIWYWPIAVNKARMMWSTSSKTTVVQPSAPYSDALERAFLTLRDWTKNENNSRNAKFR